MSEGRLFSPLGWLAFAIAGAVLLIGVPALNLASGPGSALHLPDYLVPLLGKYPATRCWRFRLDLVWGYAGILCLGHGAFFALGGYAMGMYLMRQIGTRGVYGHPELPDFMVFLNWQELPWYWWGFDHFAVRGADGAAGAGPAGPGVRLARLPLAGHRRLSLDHHPGDDLRPDAGVLPQRHGVRRQQRADRLQGHCSASTCRRRAPGSVSTSPQRRGPRRRLPAVPLHHPLQARPPAARACATPRAGCASSAIRSTNAKLFVFTVSAMLAGIAGALYVPQVGIINPCEFSPANSIEIAIWVAVGGRGTLVGAHHRRGAGQLRPRATSRSRRPSSGCSCSAACSSLSTLFLPKGIVGTDRSASACRGAGLPRCRPAALKAEHV